MSLRAIFRGVRRWIGKPWTIGAGVALAVVLTALTGIWDAMELRWLDRSLRLRGPLRVRGDVAIVGIGEDTFEKLERPWPLPRAVIARAIEHIEAGGPKAIGIDILFTEPSIFGPADDAALATVLRTYDNVVLGALFLREVDDAVAAGPGVQTRIYRVLRLPVPPLPQSPMGFVNLLHDPDGVVRRLALHQDFRTVGRVDSLAAQVAKVATRGGTPARPAGQVMAINFRGGERTFETIPFHVVVRGGVEPQAFAGKIVLVGATTPALHDMSNTPFAPQAPMPGVEIQANALDNLLRGDWLVPAGRVGALLLALLAGGLGTYSGSRIRPPRSFLLVAAASLAYAVVAHAALAWLQIWFEQVPIHLALFGAYFAMLVSGAPFRSLPPDPSASSRP